MFDRIWTLKLTQSVVSVEADENAEGKPIGCKRETTIVLERSRRKNELPLTRDGKATPNKPMLSSWDWLSVTMILTGIGVLPQMGWVYPNALGISDHDWMLIGFVMAFLALPIYVESGKSRD